MKHLKQLFTIIIIPLLILAGMLRGVLAQDGKDHAVFLPLIAGNEERGPSAEIIPGQYIVVMRSAAALSVDEMGVLRADAMALVSAQGGIVFQMYENALSGFAAQMSEEAVTTLADSPHVAFIEPDQVVYASDTQNPATWGLDRIDQRDPPLNNSYTYDATGVGVHAYIIDSGIRATHQEFSGRLGNGATAINDGRGTGDCDGHGTHVAGTVGGSTYGVAKQVTLHAVRVLDCQGSGSTSGVIAGIDWVTANHRKPAVANMSLGGSASAALDVAVRNSIAAGVTYVVAAGNENANACTVSPARVPDALTVGATTQSDVRSSFSNWGTCLDFFAPGSSITSAGHSSDTATATFSGTSMASPHVAGVVALYLQNNPNAAPSQVMNALASNASSGKVSNIGAGSPNRLLYSRFDGSTPSPTPPSTGTPTPAVTPTPGICVEPTLMPTGTPGTPSTCTDKLTNGDFEAGVSSWQEASTHGYPLICDSTRCDANLTPHSGAYVAWLGGAHSEVSEVRQSVHLPSGQRATLRYWYRINSRDHCGYDIGTVAVIVNGVRDTLMSYDLCTDEETNGWVMATLDLSQYAGSQITLVLQAQTDNSLLSSLFFDDVAVLSGNSCPAGQVVSATAEAHRSQQRALLPPKPTTEPTPKVFAR